MAAPKIVDPVKTIERCFERKQEALKMAEHYETINLPYCAKLARRRAAALQSTITRVSRQYLGAK